MDKNFVKQFRTIGKLQTAVRQAKSLHQALHDCLHIIVDEYETDYAVEWIIDKGEEYCLRPEYWLCPIDMSGCICNTHEGLVSQVIDNDQPTRILEYKRGMDPVMDEDFQSLDIGSVVCVPMSTETELFGCIVLANSTESQPFTEEDADMFEVMATMVSLEIADADYLQVDWKFNELVMKARDIKKEFHNNDIVTKVLHGVNIDIYKGEFVVVLGESGCGKSTFLNCIAGLDKPTSGTFSFMDKEMQDATEAELTEFRRKNIGFVFQSYNLMPNLTAKQNLDLIAELVDDPMDSTEALELVGLGDKINNYPSQLSGGQQQRVSIARALVKRPAIMFADEPTAALDYQTSIEVLDVLSKVVEQGTTLVMVTHNEEITRMADRIVRMRRGMTYEVIINRHPAKASELVW